MQGIQGSFILFGSFPEVFVRFLHTHGDFHLTAVKAIGFGVFHKIDRTGEVTLHGTQEHFLSEVIEPALDHSGVTGGTGRKGKG